MKFGRVWMLSHSRRVSIFYFLAKKRVLNFEKMRSWISKSASYNKRPMVHVFCPTRRISSSLRARERHQSQRMLEPYAHQRRLSDGCLARKDEEESRRSKSSTARRGEAGSRFRLPDDAFRVSESSRWWLCCNGDQIDDLHLRAVRQQVGVGTCAG